ncbi:MAG: DUF1499 domain-containing protein [Planctomycetota bacterium]
MLFLPLVAVAGLYFMSMSANPPSTLGVRNGTLAECPESPNCVATQSGNDSQRMEPVSYEGSSEAIIEKIKSTVETKFARTKLISETEHYLHFEFTSLIFRFVDDVEFLIDDTSKQIHFRSASRVGYSDLGANRKRMQTIVDELNP